MTPEKQRIKIAEACGWKGPHHPDNVKGMDGWWSQNRGVWWINPQGQRVMISDVPNYLNDLNAMHEVEKVLLGMCDNDPQADLWISYLANLVLAAPCCLREHATAAQRAKAFLRTLNLWES